MVKDQSANPVNDLLSAQSLSNRYFALRHGHSEANRAGIIVSLPQNGLHSYGLSGTGRKQVKRSLAACDDLDSNTQIVSSDFKRARETAQIVHETLGCLSPILCDQRLRERNFGDFELDSDSCYAQVWIEDARDANARPGSCESANQVMDRVTNLIRHLDQSKTTCCYLLVSHGDALQILQTAFLGVYASRHREIEHLETAEIRELRYRGED